MRKRKLIARLGSVVAASHRMKTVLAAVDGSPPALKGVWWAAQLAKALGARLELVYVTFPNLLPPHAYAKVIAQIAICAITFAYA